MNRHCERANAGPSATFALAPYIWPGSLGEMGGSLGTLDGLPASRSG